MWKGRWSFSDSNDLKQAEKRRIEREEREAGKDEQRMMIMATINHHYHHEHTLNTYWERGTTLSTLYTLYLI